MAEKEEAIVRSTSHKPTVFSHVFRLPSFLRRGASTDSEGGEQEQPDSTESAAPIPRRDRFRTLTRFPWLFRKQKTAEKGRRETWGGADLVDEETAIKLREFCRRNQKANEAKLHELHHRESVVAALSKMDAAALTQDETTGASDVGQVENAPLEEESKPEDWSESAAAIEAFAKRPGSEEAVEQLIGPYDIFEPDMRSTRWTEFRDLLREARTDFDEYLRTTATSRSNRRAATVAARLAERDEEESEDL